MRYTISGSISNFLVISKVNYGRPLRPRCLIQSSRLGQPASTHSRSSRTLHRKHVPRPRRHGPGIRSVDASCVNTFCDIPRNSAISLESSIKRPHCSRYSTDGLRTCRYSIFRMSLLPAINSANALAGPTLLRRTISFNPLQDFSKSPSNKPA